MSQQNNFFKNTFERGLWTDSHFGYQPPGTYTFALNMVHETDQYRSSESEGTFIAQEQSTKEFATLPARPVGYGLVESRDWGIFFLSNNEIGYVNFSTGEYETIYSGSCFNFHECEWIEPEIKFEDTCKDLVIYFSSRCHYYKLGVDELLRNTDYCTTCNRQSDECCDHFRLFKETTTPIVKVERYEGGGAGAPSGSYSFVVRQVDESGNKTNWFRASQPVPLVGPNGKPGEPSNNALKVEITGLDSSYSKVHVGVIQKIGGAPIARFIGTYPSSTQGVTITYSGRAQENETLSLEEILVPKKKYVRGKNLKIHNNRLHLYNLQREKQLNTFKYSSQVNTEIVAYAVPAESAHKYFTLERGAILSLGMVYNYIDGTSSMAGHVIGGGGSAASTTDFDFYEAFDKAFNRVNYNNVERNDRRSGGGPSDIYDPEESDLTPSPNPISGGSGSVSGSSGGFTATFGSPKRPIEEKDINNNFMEEQEEQQLIERLQNFQTYAPETFSKSCMCSQCTTSACVEAMEEWENDIKAQMDLGVNTAWLRRNEVSPNPKDKANFQGPTERTGSFKQAAQNMFDNANSARDKNFSARQLNVSGRTSLTAPPQNKFTGTKGRIAEIPRELIEIGSFPSTAWTSSVKYPGTKDCAGDFVYGGYACNPIRHHQVPWGDQVPIVVSAADGTISRYTLDSKEKGDTYVILLGLRFTDIPLPDPEDLPKPLSKTNPVSFVWQERDAANTNIIAKGVTTGMFEGNIPGGKAALFGRHGINAGEYIDRAISDGADQSRLGSGPSDAGFLFHSPTTDIIKPILDVDGVKVENNVSGSGNRLGLYAESPTHGKWDEPIIDNRGYRGSLNLNHLSPAGGEAEVSGITYVPADSVVTPVGGLSTPICNRYRERSVFVAASIGTPVDASWQGDTVDHYCPITNVQTQYVALTREIPDMYGSLEGAAYIPLGIEVTENGFNGSTFRAEGTCGDVYISMYTKKRSAYISDKNGNDLSGDVELWDSLKYDMGMHDFWSLPEDGNAVGEDVKDPKSKAGTQGPKRCSPGEVTSSQYDVYLPSVAKTLIMFWCESKVNSDWREVGDPELGEVWYGNLKTLEFDSDTPKQQDWKNCWMNRFYAEHIRPSKKQHALRVAIRAGIAALSAILVFNQSTGPDEFIGLLPKAGITTVMYYILNKMLFNNRILNRMLGIREWYLDDNEGNLESEYVKQFEDIYCNYNLDYSDVNPGKIYWGIPEYFYDCDCSSCAIEDTSNEIVTSNPQIPGSPIDSFSQFEPNSLITIPAGSGKLRKLFELNGILYAHTTDGISQLSVDTSAYPPSETGNPYFFTPPGASGGVVEGVLGTVDPHFSTTTKWGHVFIDREHRSINILSGSGTEVISEKGMKNFWKTFMDFCSNDCEDQRNGNSYVMGVDNRHNRILITKNVKNDKNQSFTLSYDMERGVWRSFHSYIPMMYAWTRRDMFSVDGNTVYLHDNSRGDYLTLHGKKQPAILEVNVVAPSTFEYKSTIIDSEANVAHGSYAWVYNQRATFNKVVVSNRNQCSGEIRLVDRQSPNTNIYLEQDPDEIILSWQDKEWRFNQVRDYVVNPNLPIYIDNGVCSPFLQLNEANIDKSVEFRDGTGQPKLLSDKNLKYRFTFDSEESRNHLLYVKQILTYYNIPNQ